MYQDCKNVDFPEKLAKAFQPINETIKEPSTGQNWAVLPGIQRRFDSVSNEIEKLARQILSKVESVSYLGNSIDNFYDHRRPTEQNNVITFETESVRVAEDLEATLKLMEFINHRLSEITGA